MAAAEAVPQKKDKATYVQAVESVAFEFPYSKVAAVKPTRVIDV